MSTPSTPGLLAAYLGDPRRYDELLTGEGEIRAHWAALIESFTRDDSRVSARRALDLTQRLIIDNGVTYNVYADPQGADRPWALDPVPLVLPAAEWKLIEAGIEQRARLLDALLCDLYGPQRLLAEGYVPSELVFGHPNFLWPCHGIVPAQGRWLHIYAADLARAPDGHWWVLADRTQAPSGAGYALENREIVEQVLPKPIRELAVRRVAGVLGELREQLLGHGEPGENPLAVILTSGPFNETYFEHAYLARRLGIPLAEGSDLTVRDDTVYLKTLAGLRRVHTVFRRLDDDFCDPLELRSGSTLGVPGLIGAVRAKRVVIANALGTGVLECAAWLGFLPKICRRLLGEPLRLPSVATWWCGERPALEYVLDNLDRLVIKPTYPNQRFEPVFGRSLEGEARARMMNRLRKRPYAYVAQEHVALSQAPLWRPHGGLGLSAKAISVRAYAMAAQSGLQVMPGGLARVATDNAVDVVSTQRGGGSKDVWVLPDSAAVESPSVAGRGLPVPARQDDVPSRLIENLYWFGRYSVRCEDKARILRGTIIAGVDASICDAAVALCRELGIVAPKDKLITALADERNPHSLLADIRRLSWCASQARTRLSIGSWRVVSDLQRRLQEAVAAQEDTRGVLDQLLVSLVALAGFASDNMTQDAGWRLLRIGRRLERLQFAANLLAQYLRSESAAEPLHVEWLLDAYDSLRIYRTRFVVAPRLGPMLDLLLRDIEHPRSLSFQWHAIARDLAALSNSLGIAGETGISISVPTFADADLVLLEGDGPAGRTARERSADRLRALGAAGGELSDRLSLRHFAHIGLGSQALAT